MKNILKLFVALCIGLQVQAQSKITQGTVDFTISYPDLSGEMKEMESMLPHEMTVYFKNELSRNEIAAGMMGKIVTISNSKNGEMIMLMDMMGKKVAIKQTEAERKAMEEGAVKKGMMPAIKVTKVEGTKTIAGYLCKKAIIEVTESGKSYKAECYYTEQLPKMKDQNEAYFKDINGFMMEYTISQAGVKMMVSVKSIASEKVDDSKFAIPEEYEQMTQADLEKMMGAGMGE